MLTALLQYYVEVSQEALACTPPYRGRVEMTHFDHYTLITSEADGVIRRRWFLDDSPIYNYHLAPDTRRSLVGPMFKAGYRASEIAELIGVNDSTVSADLKLLRQNASHLVEPQMKAVDTTPPDCVLKSSTAMKPLPPQYVTAHDWVL